MLPDVFKWLARLVLSLCQNSFCYFALEHCLSNEYLLPPEYFNATGTYKISTILYRKDDQFYCDYQDLPVYSLVPRPNPLMHKGYS